jgi:hypothetical protein
VAELAVEVRAFESQPVNLVHPSSSKLPSAGGFELRDRGVFTYSDIRLYMARGFGRGDWWALTVSARRFA